MTTTIKVTTLIFVLQFFSAFGTYAQKSHKLFVANNFQKSFEKAYEQFPDIPKGVLEAVSFSMTRFHNHKPKEETCTGVPGTYGPMGLTLNGENYFRNNLQLVSSISGYSIKDIIDNPEINILAYAKAYNYFLQKKSAYSIQNQYKVLIELSELPYNGLQADFALNSFLYQVYWFLNNETAQQKYNLPKYNIDLYEIFGANLDVLSSTRVILDSHNNVISDNKGHYYVQSGFDKSINSTDYPPAIEDLTTCNYSSRNGTAVTAVAIHDIEGSYSGCISWFKNCNANASAHYVLRSSDGQVTQMVLEADKAWHVRDENPYTIGLEHEGYMDETGWYTEAMYQSSADLVIDITNSGYGINPKRTAYFPWAPTAYYADDGIPGECIRIKGHQHYPNNTHTDPGPNWDWDYYYKLINEPTSTVSVFTDNSGTITDDGGASANYTNDQRSIYSIRPQNAQSITLDIQQFEIEDQWDYLYIYEGDNVFAPLYGYYTSTNIPSTININAPAVTIEFRSDCATNAPGFVINWQAVVADTVPPVTAIQNIPSPYASSDFQASFVDNDNQSGIKYRLYSVSDYNGQNWGANPYHAFAFDDFDILNSEWTQNTGSWAVNNGTLIQSDESNANTNISQYLNQNDNTYFIYHFKATISGSGTNKRAGLHYMCNNPTADNRGNSYLFYFREDDDRIEFYKSVNDTLQSVSQIAYTFNAGETYDFKIFYNKTVGSNAFWINDQIVGWWVDPSPIQTGDYVSFRSGNCTFTIDSFEVYKNRSVQELISIGNDIHKDIRFEDSGNIPGGKIKSLVIDSANNISQIAVENVHIDFNSTPNTDPVITNDTIYITTNENTPIEICIDATDADNDTLGICNISPTPVNGSISNYSNSSLCFTYTPNNGFTGNDQLGVIVCDGNGGSDEATIIISMITNVNSAKKQENISVFPNPFTDKIVINNDNNSTYSCTIIGINGKKLIYEDNLTGKSVINLKSLQKGVYMIKIDDGNSIKTTTIVKK